MANTCPYCQSDIGYYEGPNGKDRCYNCFMEMADEPTPEEANRNIEPNVPVKDKSVKSPASTASTKAKDKAEDSPAKQEKVPPTAKERAEAARVEAEKEAAKVGTATPVKDKHVPSPAKAKTKG